VVLPQYIRKNMDNLTTNIKNSAEGTAIDLSETLVCKYLGYKRGRVSPRIKNCVRQTLKILNRLARPAWCCRIYPVTVHGGHIYIGNTGFRVASRKIGRVLSVCTHTAVCAVTLGRQVDAFINTGSPHETYIRDTAASLAAEDLMDQCQEHIETALPPLQGATKRYSPGYCDWNVSAQQGLFRLFPADKLGIRLSDSFLMSPRKSITAVFGIGKRAEVDEYGNACFNCEYVTCPHRRISSKEHMPEATAV
jgi:hypothetical protein